MQLEIQSGIAIAGIVYGIFAFLAPSCELVKDMEDVSGDRHGNCKTIPIVLGIKGAKGIAFYCYFLSINWHYSFGFSFYTNKIRSIYNCVGVAIAIVANSCINYISNTAKQFYYTSNLIKLFMFLGISTMLLFYRRNRAIYIYTICQFLRNYYSYMKNQSIILGSTIAETLRNT